MLKAGPLEERFRALRRRVAALASLSGLGWALLAAAAVWLAFAWFDLLWELSPAARIAANTLAVIAAIVGLASALWRARQDGRPLVLAGRLDEAAATGGQIRSGYDLAVESADLQALESGDSQALLIAQHDTAKVLARLHAELRRGLAHFDNRSRGNIGGNRLVIAGRVHPNAANHRCQHLRRGALLRRGGAVHAAAGRDAMAALQRPGGRPPALFANSIRHRAGWYSGALWPWFGSESHDQRPAGRAVELVLQGSATEPEEVLPMFPESDGHWRGVLSRVTTPTQYFVRAGRARSQRYGLEVIMIPRLESVRFRITPPAYTRRPPYDGPVPQAGIAGLKGTKVEVWAKSNRPLAGGSVEVALDKGRTPVGLRPLPDDDQQVTGAFEIRSAGKLESASPTPRATTIRTNSPRP